MKGLALFLLLSAPALAQFELPNRAQRVKALEDAGFLQELATLDELDQDLLYMKARRVSLPELRAAYPALPKQKLERLKALAKEAR